MNQDKLTFDDVEAYLAKAEQVVEQGWHVGNEDARRLIAIVRRQAVDAAEERRISIESQARYDAIEQEAVRVRELADVAAKETYQLRDRLADVEAGRPHWCCETCHVLNRADVAKCTSCSADKPELFALRDRLAKLESALKTALDEWEHASQYKGEFLAAKHGDAEDIAELRKLLEAKDGAR